MGFRHLVAVAQELCQAVTWPIDNLDGPIDRRLLLTGGAIPNVATS
jgi:hypothetical protein